MKREKNKAYNHLGEESQVTIPQNKKLWIGGILFVLVILIFILMLFSSPQQTKSTHHHQTQHTDNNQNILLENAKRLKKLEKKPRAHNHSQPHFKSIANTSESKALLARQNAPTQMYTAKHAAQSSTTSKNHSANLLIGKNRYSQFANQQNSESTTVSATQITHPHYTIAQGELISAVLETAINSELPGMIRAVTTRPVYAYQGEKPLLPAGSRLIGQYTSVAGNGSATARVFVIWNRIITPHGISIMLNSPGSDALGRAGLKADVINSHFLKIFGTATLLSILGASAATYQVNSSDQPNSANQYRQAITSALQQSAQNSLRSNLQINPTLSIQQGKLINVFVAHDLDLYQISKQHG